MNRAPRPWLAALLNLVVTPFGMLYVARPGWAGLYLLLGLALAALDFFLPESAAVLGLRLLFAAVAALHAYRLARQISAGAQRPFYSRAPGLLGIGALLLLLLIGLRAFVVEPFRMPSESMLPTLNPGAQFLVRKWGFGHYETLGLRLMKREPTTALQRGDLVVFVHAGSGHKFVKRLIGLPGDRLLLGTDLLQLNGQSVRREPAGEFTPRDGDEPLPVSVESLGELRYRVIAQGDRPYPAIDSALPALQQACQRDSEGLHCQVPAGHYFMLGDHRPNSADSRAWGFVPAANLVGRVAFSP